MFVIENECRKEVRGRNKIVNRLMRKEQLEDESDFMGCFTSTEIREVKV